MPLDTAFATASELIEGKRGNAVKQAAEFLKRGGSVSKAFEKMRLFSFSELWLIKGVEKSGNLAEALYSIAELRETNLETRIEIMSSTIQPILIILMGIIVGTIAVQTFGGLIQITNHLIAQM